jgi:hypothetical protein
MGGMGVGLEAEAKSTLAEDNHKDIEGFILLALRLFDDMERSEGSEVVGREELDLLTCFLSDNVLDGKGMNTESLADAGDLLLSRAVDVKPPDTIRLVLGQLKKATNVLARKNKVAHLSCMDGRLPRRREEAEPVVVDRRLRLGLGCSGRSLRLLLLSRGIIGGHIKNVTINGGKLHAFVSRLSAQILEALLLAVLGIDSGGHVKLLLSLDEALKVLEIDIELILAMVILQWEADVLFGSLVGQHAGSIVDGALLAAKASTARDRHGTMSTLLISLDEGRATLAATGLGEGLD